MAEIDAEMAIAALDRLMTLVMQFRMGVATVETLHEMDALILKFRGMMKQLEAMQRDQGRREGSDREG